MRPAVITDVADDSRLMQEEIFGPVTCIVPFRTEEEVGNGGRELCMHAPFIVPSLPPTLPAPPRPPSPSLQVIQRANNVRYGLSACVWSENSGTTHRVAQALDVSSFLSPLSPIFVHVYHSWEQLDFVLGWSGACMYEACDTELRSMQFLLGFFINRISGTCHNLRTVVYFRVIFSPSVWDGFPAHVLLHVC